MRELKDLTPVNEEVIKIRAVKDKAHLKLPTTGINRKFDGPDAKEHAAKAKKQFEKDGYHVVYENQQIREDATDDMKHQKLNEIDKMTAMLSKKINELAKLDSADGSTGAGDLTDQLVSFDKGVKYIMGVSSRSHKIVPESVDEMDNVEEASGEFAEPIYDLIDMHFEGDCQPVFDDLVKYLDGDTIRDFVDDFRRHHDLQVDDEGNRIDDSVNEAEGNKTITVNKNIDLAGDSIWQGEDRGEEVVYKTFVHEITMNTDEDGYLSVTVKHEGPWTIYTDSGFEEEISGIIGHDVSFSEQGMQEDGMAHLEGETGGASESKQEQTMEELDRILQIAGIQKAPVAEEKIDEKCGCDDPKCDDPTVHEDEKVDEGRKPYPGEYDYTDEKHMDADGTPKSDDDDDKKKEKAKESVEEAKKELDEEPNEGNEFAHELKKAKDAGKDEFEVGGKKYKVKKESVETDEEVVAEAPTMDTTQLINLLKNSGLTEEKIKAKIDEWANTPAGVGEQEPTQHAGEANDDFAQAVNLSLKRYLDAQDMKIKVNENHSVDGMKAKYNAHKDK